MKLRVGSFSLVALCLLFSGFAAADYPLSADFELAPPPSPNSPEALSDYAELHRWQDTRTQAECFIAGTQSRMDIGSFFGVRTGVLTGLQMNAVADLLFEIKGTVDQVSKRFKTEYARPRPYVVDHTLNPCIEKPKGATSYPSSHAAMGIVMSRVLADLLPEARPRIEAQGIQIGTNRVLGGVHHPSDVRAGQYLGDRIYEALQTNAGFLADFDRTRQALH